MAVDRWFTAAWQAEHPEQVEAVRQRLAGNDPDSYLKAYQVFVDGDPVMPGGAGLIDAPTLAMTGELDPGSTPAMSVAMAGEIPNGQARILIGLHHLPPIEAPRTFAESLLDFLDQEAAR
jgi:pimeloyl-ACP methyl ester carboxylesterase